MCAVKIRPTLVEGCELVIVNANSPPEEMSLSPLERILQYEDPEARMEHLKEYRQMVRTKMRMGDDNFSRRFAEGVLQVVDALLEDRVLENVPAGNFVEHKGVMFGKTSCGKVRISAYIEQEGR